MTVQAPSSIKLRNALASPPPNGATFASFVLFTALGALLAMMYVGSEWLLNNAVFGFSSDAGWVRAVFARNLASGNILCFSPGVPVAGVAAPAWIVPLGLLGYLTGYVFAAKLLGAACVVLAAFLMWRMTLDLLGDWRFAFLAGLAVVASPLLMTAAVSGTEGALAALLVAALIYWAALSYEGAPRQRVMAAIIAGLAALTRPELILLLPLLLIDRWLTAARHAPAGRRLRSAVAYSVPEVVGAAVVLVPYVLFNLRAGGPLWQQPELALRAQPAWSWMAAVALGLWANNPLLACAAVLGLPVVALAAARSNCRHPSFLLVMAPIAVMVAPGFIWKSLSGENAALAAGYLIPIVAALSSAGLFFLKRTGESVLRSRARAARIALGAGIGAALAGLVALTWMAHRDLWQQYGVMVKKQNDLQGAIGRWVTDHTAPDASIASRQVGEIAFFSRRRMIDLGGTVDRQALEYLRRPGSADANLFEFIQKMQPSYLAIRASDFPDLSQRVDVLTPTVTCTDKDPLTGGETTWVLYETPWPPPSARAVRSQASEENQSRRRRH